MQLPDDIPFHDRNALGRWIRERRDPSRRRALDPGKPAGWLLESEPEPGGETSVLTVFLTNRECPWTCLMCDLWQGTLGPGRPPASPLAQMDAVLGSLPIPLPRDLKLYNAGSFFDQGAIPRSDHEGIAHRARPFRRLVVENHPRLTDGRILEFRQFLEGTRLELALGLETADPELLRCLNKGFTVDDFRRAAAFLAEVDVDLRVFVLVQPPLVVDPAAAIDGACRAIDLAQESGARVVSVIPTRPGNGAMEVLARRGLYRAPTVATVEAVLEHAWGRRRGWVLVDTWDLARAVSDAGDPEALGRRWEAMNAAQSVLAGREGNSPEDQDPDATTARTR